ncbi:MAG: hypothetical protein RL226_2007 [Bacteroidota bacterium]|jgi:hypothetical protein
MIQRIQTVYLLLAIVCIGSVFFFNIGGYQDTTAHITEIGMYKVTTGSGEVTPTVKGNLAAIMASVALVMLVLTVFQYKHRKRQIQFARLSYLLVMLVIGVFWWVLEANYWTKHIEGAVFDYGVSFYLPFAAIAFIWLANRGIKADEDLVRSLDRIR